MVLGGSAFATTIVMPTDEQLIAKSPVIVEGTVMSTTPVHRGNAIWTETTVSVAKAIKGNVAGTITVSEMGGVIDDHITKIFGAPEFAAGEHVLLFLTPTSRGDYQTTDLYIGKFTEERTLDGQMLWSRHDEAGDVALLDASFQPIAARNVQRDASAFTTYVTDRVAGRAGAKNYGIENPVLDTVNDNSGGRARPEFTVISEPQIYRWFTFDQGGSVAWSSWGTQPGYSGGGVNEIQTAMNAWNSYSSAKISYTYAGVESGSNPGGLSATNGINEVLFNDPKNEISGSWDPSKGGVVGQGGFNGVGGSTSWTAPFAADATHTQKTYTVWRITEGNLVIQDNVSSSTGISSARLAEIVAHEFGHTLGFGHSADNTALMYATVTGLGASLRADDQLAARWLYPNGSQTSPSPATVPAAPSGLTASASGSNVTLNWTDNATNETGQSIYVSSGGAFSKVTDVAASAKTATLTGFSAGTYSFYVVAYNAAGNSSASNTASATVGAALQASFAASALSGVAGQTTFTFTDQSTGTITSRLWQFGDATTSTQQNPSHIYSAAGQYNVTLTVSGGGASSSTTRTIFVSAPTVQLSANFSWSPVSPTTADNVSFTDQSSNATTWSWSFGDGTTSTQQNPVKRFTVAGVYSVTLTISNGGQTAATSKSIIVASAIPATPSVSAGFGWSPSNPTTGSTVAFDEYSSGSPTAWSWSFGDGTTSNVQRATHIYSVAGAYTITLTASNGGSSSTVSHTIVIAQGSFTTRSLVSASAQTNGIGGSVWRTELTLFNAGDSVSVNLILLPGNGEILTRTIFLGPKQSVTYANALLDVFNLSSGAGAIAVEATSAASTPDVRVSSRTFTNGTAGTYGQAVPEVTGDDLDTKTYLTALASSPSYRTNVGIANRGASAGSVLLQLYDASGAFVASSNVPVAPSSFQQAPLSTYFPTLGSRTLDAASIVVTSSQPGSISVYGSVIDNRSQDPIYVQAARLRVGSTTMIPGVGRVAGLNGTFWRSDVTIFNPGSTKSTVSMRLLAAGADNRNATWQTITVNANQTLVLADVASRFTGTANINGALELSWSGGQPVITSRTYTTDDNGGTFGQSIDPVAAYGSDQYVPGLRSDFAFRTNAGFVNNGDQTIGINLSLLSSNGLTLATGFVAVPPKSLVQSSLGGLFPGLNVSNLGSVTLKAHTDSGATMSAYGSIIDNVSGDPVFFAGR